MDDMTDKQEFDTFIIFDENGKPTYLTRSEGLVEAAESEGFTAKNIEDWSGDDSELHELQWI